MYAVIRTGSSQTRVEQGQVVRIDRRSEAEGSTISLVPVMIVAGDTVLSTPSDLAAATVTAQVMGEEKGPKIRAMTYKAKANVRKRWGHRQKYTAVEITKISAK